MGKKGSKNPLHGMKGQMGMGLVFLFLGGLMLSGFALDSGVIFLKRSQMQKILDSAALNGVAASVNGKSPQEVRTWVQRFVRHQATKQGIEMVGEANVDVQAPSNTSSLTKVRVSVRANCNYLMAKFLSSFTSGGSSASTFGLLVRAAAATSRRPVILSMIFDTSGSMGEIVNGQPKIVPAKDAAKQLVDVLSYPEDQMAFISYELYATVRTAPMGSTQGMLKVNEDGNGDFIKNAIDGLAPNGYTNMAQGVLKGRQQIEGAEVTPGVDYRRIVILFTDGIPNIVSTRFPDARNTIVGNKDFFDSREVRTLGNNGSSNYPPQYFKDINEVSAPCSGNGNGAANTCLEKWTYLDSMGAAMGGGIPLVDGVVPLLGSIEYDFLRKIFADLTIREADYAKDLYAGDPDKRVTFYSVGLGTPSAIGTDPYEFGTEEAAVRAILLRKLANDPRAAADPQFIPGTSNLNGTQEEGQFYQTPNPATLAQTFKDIINADLKTIKVTDYGA